MPLPAKMTAQNPGKMTGKPLKASISLPIPLTKKIKAIKKEEVTDPLPVRLRRAFEKLGPTFMKFGQMLSLRPDFLPKEYIAELSKLQDKAPEFSYKEVEETIKEEFGKKIEELFKEFEKKPFAAASLTASRASRGARMSIARSTSSGISLTEG